MVVVAGRREVMNGYRYRRMMLRMGVDDAVYDFMFSCLVSGKKKKV